MIRLKSNHRLFKWCMPRPLILVRLSSCNNPKQSPAFVHSYTAHLNRPQAYANFPSIFRKVSISDTGVAEADHRLKVTPASCARRRCPPARLPTDSAVSTHEQTAHQPARLTRSPVDQPFTRTDSRPMGRPRGLSMTATHPAPAKRLPRAQPSADNGPHPLDCITLCHPKSGLPRTSTSNAAARLAYRPV